MQTSNLPSEAKQSVCRNQYHTPSCRPIVPCLSWQSLTKAASAGQCPTNSNNGRRATTSRQLGTLCALDLTRSSSHSPCCRAEKDLRVVRCLGSLRLLEPSRKTPTMPVGCTPFPFFLFFYPLSHSPFLLLSSLSLSLPLSLSSALKLPGLWPYLCVVTATHILSSLLALSCNSDVLPLFLKCLSVELIFFFFSIAGLHKRGARGEESFLAAHACQMWCRRKKPAIKMHRKGRRRRKKKTRRSKRRR